MRTHSTGKELRKIKASNNFKMTNIVKSYYLIDERKVKKVQKKLLKNQTLNINKRKGGKFAKEEENIEEIKIQESPETPPQ